VKQLHNLILSTFYGKRDAYRYDIPLLPLQKKDRKNYGFGHLESELLPVCESQVEGDVGALHAQVRHDKLLGTVALVLHVQGCDLNKSTVGYLLIKSYLLKPSLTEHDTNYILMLDTPVSGSNFQLIKDSDLKTNFLYILSVLRTGSGRLLNFPE
jgi:hypothetical protein